MAAFDYYSRKMPKAQRNALWSDVIALENLDHMYHALNSDLPGDYCSVEGRPCGIDEFYAPTWAWLNNKYHQAAGTSSGLAHVAKFQRKNPYVTGFQQKFNASDAEKSLKSFQPQYKSHRHDERSARGAPRSSRSHGGEQSARSSHVPVLSARSASSSRVPPSYRGGEYSQRRGHSQHGGGGSNPRIRRSHSTPRPR